MINIKALFVINQNKKRQLLTAFTLCALPLPPAANAQPINGYNKAVFSVGTMQDLSSAATGVMVIQSNAAYNFEPEQFADNYFVYAGGYQLGSKDYQIPISYDP